MTERVFIDTNILIYAHDVRAGSKRIVAERRLTDLWRSRTGVLSTHVLQEFYVNVTRKIPSPLPSALARQVLANYTTWEVQVVTPELVLRASEIEEEHRLSFWDALIVAAASAANVGRILSEDFTSSRKIEGITIENPFAVAPT